MSNVLFDAFSSGSIPYNSTKTVTISHTATGANLAMVVMISADDPTHYPSSVTCDGVAMTLVRAETAGVGSSGTAIYVPPAVITAGVHSIVVNTPDIYCVVSVQVLTFTNATQAPVSSTGGRSANYPSPISHNVTVPAGGVAVDVVNAQNYAVPLTIIGAQVQPAAAITVSSPASYWTTTSYLLDATSIGWTFTGGGNRQAAHSVVVFAPYAAPSATISLAPANLSSGATLATANVSVAPPVAGVVNLAVANLSSGATLATAAVGVVQPQGTLTSDIFKAWGSPAALAGLTVPRVVALKLDGTVALNLAAQVTNGAGRVVLVSASLVAGTSYMLATWNADGSARGLKAYTAT